MSFEANTIENSTRDSSVAQIKEAEFDAHSDPAGMLASPRLAPRRPAGA